MCARARVIAPSATWCSTFVDLSREAGRARVCEHRRVRVQLLYFAAVRDLIGVDGESVMLDPEITSVSSLRRWLDANRAPLEGRLASVRFAIDERFANDDEPLHEGAVIALIPPVAGG